jgi:hypothetical protein
VVRGDVHNVSTTAGEHVRCESGRTPPRMSLLRWLAQLLAGADRPHMPRLHSWACLQLPARQRPVSACTGLQRSQSGFTGCGWPGLAAHDTLSLTRTAA